MKKLQEMMTEEEKQRIPVAQGLPWTTDEPEVSLSTVKNKWEHKMGLTYKARQEDN